MNDMTKKDFVAVTEGAKNKIIERLVTKYDVQAAADSARDRVIANLQVLHQENQALQRQSNAQKDQVWRRVAALEAQIAGLYQEVRAMHQTINEALEEPVNQLRI